MVLLGSPLEYYDHLTLAALVLLLAAGMAVILFIMVSPAGSPSSANTHTRRP